MRLQCEDWKRAEDLLRHAAQQLLVTADELRLAEQRLSLRREPQRRELLRRLQRARAYLHDHVADGISLDRLADVCQVSRFHLLRCFREAFGSTPAQYHADLRLQRASFLLTQKMPVAEVARALGYRSHSAFTRAWKRRHGCAPTLKAAQR
jgi:AraC-like DNA-binding protein